MNHLLFSVLAKLWRDIGNADSAGENVRNALGIAKLIDGCCIVRFGMVKLHVFASLSKILQITLNMIFALGNYNKYHES